MTTTSNAYCAALGISPPRIDDAKASPEANYYSLLIMDQALEAMSAPELRAAIRVVLDQLDDGVKDSIIDALPARGAKATSGWKPSRPSPRIVEEAKSFAEAARQIGQADPDDVTEHLRRATEAFLAADRAREIDLGRHEHHEPCGADAGGEGVRRAAPGRHGRTCDSFASNHQGSTSM